MIRIVPIDTGEDFSSKPIIQATEDGLTDVADRALKDFGLTIQAWNDKPTFDVQVDTLKRTVGTDSLHYAYINSGTHVRYATMTRDFQRKTEPKVLNSTMGQGGVLFVSLLHPKPGIQARDFDAVIADKYDQQIEQIIQAHINALP